MMNGMWLLQANLTCMLLNLLWGGQALDAQPLI
jgi:hypothetical protein